MTTVAIGSRLQRVRRAGPALPIPTLTRGLSHAAGADINIDLTWSTDAHPAGTALTGWALDTITAGVTTTETLAAATTSTTKALSAASERAYRVRAVYGTVTSPLSAAVSSALAGELMRVAITAGTTEDEVYRASPAEGSILAGAFETSDGLVLNRIRINTAGTQLIVNRSLADSTITLVDFFATNDDKSFYVITADGMAEFANDPTPALGANSFRWTVAASDARQAILAGITPLKTSSSSSRRRERYDTDPRDRPLEARRPWLIS